MWTCAVGRCGYCLQAVSAFAQTPSPALAGAQQRRETEMAIVDPSAMKVVGHVPVGEGRTKGRHRRQAGLRCNYGSNNARAKRQFQ